MTARPDSLLHVVFLDSWLPDSHDGTGTAVGIANLATALRGRGHTVEILRPPHPTPTVVSRVAFNLALPRTETGIGAADLVVGFDLDGFRWSSTRDSTEPYVVALKGIAADEARFARSIGERLHLSALSRLERLNARRADRVLVPSRYSARVAVERYGLDPLRMEVVPEAVDLEGIAQLRESRRSIRRTDPGAATILSVARQYPRKDTATLLRALPRILLAHPHVSLRVIGGGPELPRLRFLANALGLSEVARFEGIVEDDAIVQTAYVDADVFCLPSRQEGFGISFVEAMSAALPVVAARAGAAPEIVEHGRTGLLVPPGDAEALARAIVQLLDRPQERRRMGLAGTRAARRYGLAPVGGRFLEAVRPILRPAKRGIPSNSGSLSP